MVGAIFTVHLQNGFFMNWMGNQKGEGYEYHILAIGMALACWSRERRLLDRPLAAPDRGIYR